MSVRRWNAEQIHGYRGLDVEYVLASDYDALAEDAKNLASERDSLEGRIRELEACVLEYWQAKDWDAVGAADAKAAKLLPALAGSAADRKGEHG